MPRAPFFGSQVALQRVADVLQRLAHAETRRVQRTTLIVVEYATHRRTIIEYDLPHLVLAPLFPSRGRTSRIEGAGPGDQAETTRHRGRGHSICWARGRCREVGTQRGSGLGGLGWGGKGQCCGFLSCYQHTPFDGAQPPHFAAHLYLGMTVHVYHGLLQRTEKVVCAVAVRRAW